MAPVTSPPWLVTWADVAVTVGAWPGWVAWSWGVPAVVGNTGGPATPPADESRTSWSMFQPVQVAGVLAQGGLCPGAVCTTCGPAPRAIPAASGPHGTSCSSPPSRACWAEPTTATWMGRPSMVSRLATQGPGRFAGVAPDCAFGIPISAMPSGSASGPAE